MLQKSGDKFFKIVRLSCIESGRLCQVDVKAGYRFLTVDAYLDAVPFYVKNEFQFMNAEDDDPHTRLMYYDLMDLEE